MRLPKSEKAQTALSVIGMVVAVLLFYGLPSVLAPVFSPILHQVLIAQSDQPAEARSTNSSVAATVNLPPGQRFMYIIPKEEADKLGIGKPGLNIYVTSEAKPDRIGVTLTSPRLVRFLQPGNTPGSWEEVLYIQER